MPVAIPEFWRLVIESRLIPPQVCQQLGASFGQLKGTGDPNNAKALSEWLISQSMLSRYQADILLAGRSGPFFYGDYKVYDRIATGRLAGCFRAVHAATNHPVLLQFLTGPYVQDPRQWAAVAPRLQQQCGLVHPQLPRCYDVVDLQSFKFLVVEDLRGQPLDERLATAGRIPPQEACRIARFVATAITQLHRLGVPHGDIRPATVFCEQTGNVRLLRDPASFPGPINFQGDPQIVDRLDYLAPEFLQPGRPPDAFSDIYGLGCLLYRLLTGSPPFPGGDPGSKLQRHATQPYAPLEQFGMPPQLSQLVNYMLAKNPAGRIPQMQVAVDQLTPFCDPAQLNVQPLVPPTAQVFDTYLRQKATMGPAAASAPMPAPAAAPVVRPVAAAPTAAPAVRPVAPAVTPVVNVAAPRPAAAPVAKVAPVAAAVPASGGLNIVAEESATMAKLKGKTAKPAEPLDPAAAEKKKMIVIGSSLGGAALLLILLIVLLNMGRSNNDATPPENNNVATNNPSNDPPVETEPVETTPTANPADPSGKKPYVEPAVKYELVADDGKLLWGSPTAGSPVSFEYVPSGGRAFLAVRGSDLVASAEGNRVLKSLGPDFAAARAKWESAAGVTLADAERLLVALFPNDDNFPLSTFTVTLKSGGPTVSALAAKWGAAKDVNGEKVYTGPAGWTYYVPSAGEDRVFVLGDAEPIGRLAEVAGKATPLMREIESLRKMSDADRHCTVFFDPKFLNFSGQKLFTGRDHAREAINWFLGDELKAGLASLHFGPECYLEVRFSSDQKDRYAVAREAQGRLNEVPQAVEDRTASTHLPQDWQKVLNRFPGAVRFLHSHSRIGVEGEHAVLNAILPGVAAHNLAFSSEALIAFSGGAGPATVVAAKPVATTGPKTLEEMLNVPMSLKFDQDSLEFSMQNIEKQAKETVPNLPFEFKIKILGKDLEKDGITRNQSIRDFDQQNKKVREILTAMVRKANPDPSAKGSNDVKQKLIWVIGPDPDSPTTSIVLVTTRAAAEAKKYTLPPEFKL